MDKTIIKTHSDIIDMFGGIQQLAESFHGDFEIDYHRIWKWRNRNRIPQKYWRELIQIATRNDLTLTCWQFVDARQGNDYE